MTRRRADIQLLRGISVLMVVAYHAFRLPGGYLGVDVFFAISGFVITSSIIREVDRSGSFDIVGFLERRICRLLPALAVTVIFTALGSLFFLSPIGAGTAIGPTAKAAALNVANLQLYGAADYFSPEAELNPLLHTWSLSVEEQFYLGYALIAVLVARWAVRSNFARRLMSSLVILIGLSLIASWYLSYGTVAWADDPERLAFYLPVARAFEFLAGALLALVLLRSEGRRTLEPARSGVVRVVLGSLLLVVASIVVNDEVTPLVGAAIPLLAFFTFVSPAGSPTWLDRSTAAQPIRWLGDISYSWYLVHWPMIVFGRTFSDLGVVVAVVLSVPVALALNVLVERRFRQPSGRRRSTAILAAAVLLPLAAGYGVDAAMATGLGIDAVTDLDSRTDARTLGCHGDLDDPILGPDICTWPADPSRGLVMLVGDSHAVSLSSAVVDSANEAGFDVHVQTRSLCPFGRRRIKRRGCAGYQRDTIARIIELEPDVVIIANRAPAYVLAPDLGSTYVVVDGADEEPTDPEAALQAWDDGQRIAIEAIQDSVGQIVIVDTVPTYGDSSARETISLLRPEGRSEAISLEAVHLQRGETTAIHEQLAVDYPSVRVVDPVSVLCRNEVCSQRVDGTWWYYDDDHVSLSGAEVVIELLSPAWSLVD